MIDRLVKESNPNLINTQSLEIMTRKTYGIQLAYKHVMERADWERPKTLPASAKWESKVVAELVEEYDICPEDQDDVQPIEGADAAVRKNLPNRALIEKHLGILGGSTS